MIITQIQILKNNEESHDETQHKQANSTNVGLFNDHFNTSSNNSELENEDYSEIDDNVSQSQSISRSFVSKKKKSLSEKDIPIHLRELYSKV